MSDFHDENRLVKIRTYFWEARIISPLELRARQMFRRSPHLYFLVGNAGDILARELIEREYDCATYNDPTQGKRLLVIGSIGHSIREGDVLCGIGVKSRQVPKATDVPVRVWAVRGPITYELFKAAGHDVSDVKFQLDPGLMMRFLMSGSDQVASPRGAVFIPHYRERGQYAGGLPKGICLVDIDNRPRDVARAILSAELVYSSSLHGIIFAHALGRPCVFVGPQTEEPLIKYEDYFASIGRAMPRPLTSIHDARSSRAPDSPIDLRYTEEDFVWPSLEELVAHGVAVP
jgi:hypothetical protein